MLPIRYLQPGNFIMVIIVILTLCYFRIALLGLDTLTLAFILGQCKSLKPDSKTH